MCHTPETYYNNFLTQFPESLSDVTHNLDWINEMFFLSKWEMFTFSFSSCNTFIIGLYAHLLLFESFFQSLSIKH